MLQTLKRWCGRGSLVAAIACALMTSAESAELSGSSMETGEVATSIRASADWSAGAGGSAAIEAEASVDFLPYATSARTRPAGARRQGALYKVTLDDKAAYLFGTIHVGAQSMYPLADEVRNALKEASELILELDTRAQDAFTLAVRTHGSYAQGEHIKNFLTADTMRRLTAALHAQGITVASVAHLKPWLIANMLMGLELEHRGLKRIHGNEFILLEYAQAQGTPITELESAAYQLTLFDKLTPAQAESYLLESLASLSDGSAMRKAMATVEAWASGSASALDRLVPDAVHGDSVMASFTRHVLLGKRNLDMAARIEGIMQGGRTLFVGVGLLHLLGADGLPRLLSKRGYRVERMY